MTTTTAGQLYGNTTIRRNRKTTRAIFVHAWTDDRSYVCFVDETYNQRTHHGVTPSSTRRAQRAQLKLMEMTT